MFLELFHLSSVYLFTLVDIHPKSSLHPSTSDLTLLVNTDLPLIVPSLPLVFDPHQSDPDFSHTK